jgi:hypothetical protein
MTAPQVRAPCLYGVTKYLSSMDPAVAQQIMAGYTPEVRQALHEATPDVYYPIEYWKEAIDGIVAAQPDLTRAREAVRGIGRSICELTANSFLRLLMRMMTPSLFAKKSGAMIGRDFIGFPGGGPDYSYDVSKESEGLIFLEVRNAQLHPYLGGTGQGFCEFAFSYIGKKDVIIDEPDYPPEQWAPEHLRWRIRWTP